MTSELNKNYKFLRPNADLSVNVKLSAFPRLFEF